MAQLTKSWSSIEAFYLGRAEASAFARLMLEMIREIRTGEDQARLFAWTSMQDLCIVPTPVEYPFDGPFLRVSPDHEASVELRYVDTPIAKKQWSRKVGFADTRAALASVLMDLNWLPRKSGNEANHVFKPTAEQALRSNQSAARRRLNTALAFSCCFSVRWGKIGMECNIKVGGRQLITYAFLQVPKDEEAWLEFRAGTWDVRINVRFESSEDSEAAFSLVGQPDHARLVFKNWNNSLPMGISEYFELGQTGGRKVVFLFSGYSVGELKCVNFSFFWGNANGQ